MTIDDIIRIECTGCLACKYICPKEAIEITTLSDGFEYPKIDKNKCVKCNMCYDTCHLTKYIDLGKAVKPVTFYGTHVEKKVRTNSSSGGVFSAIVQSMGEDSGFVAARWSDELTVVKDISFNKDDLPVFRKSKYVQATSAAVFSKIEEALKNDMQIYVFGTPCFIASIKVTFKKYLSKIYLVELLCHGVPSPQLFKEYIKKLTHKEVDYYDFRNKEISSVGNFVGEILYKDGKSKIDYESYFTKGFLRNLYLRESCYECKYGTTIRIGDLVIGDAWGIIDGGSVIIPVTKKGEELINKINNKMELHSISTEDVVAKNFALRMGKREKTDRNRFYNDYIEMGMEKAIKNNLPKLNCKGKVVKSLKKWKCHLKHKADMK